MKLVVETRGSEVDVLDCVSSLSINFIFTLPQTPAMNQPEDNPKHLQPFMLENPQYSLVPPAPLPAPVQLKLYTHSEALAQHRLLSSQMAHTAPLLIACDFGLKMEDLFWGPYKLETSKEGLDPED